MWFDEDKLIIGLVLGLHEFAAVFSYILIVTHVLAAIYSRLKGEGVWSSMVPVLKEKENYSTNKVIGKLSEIEERFYDKVEDLISSKKE